MYVAVALLGLFFVFVFFFFLVLFLMYFFLFCFLTLQYCIGFAIYQHESATSLMVVLFLVF